MVAEISRFVLLSASAEYANTVVSGDVSVVIQRWWISRPVSGALIHADGFIVGGFRLTGVDRDHPMALWDKFGDKIGMTESEFHSYMGAKDGTALLVGETYRFPPEQVVVGDIGPTVLPLNFQYVDEDQALDIIRRFSPRKPDVSVEPGSPQTTIFPTSSIVANALEADAQLSKYHGKGGHGFAAEDANTFSDRIRGRRAKVVGGSNEKNGPDRIVNGVRVQSKYFRSASETVGAAFDKNTGMYRYSGQLLEVPSDQYDDCVNLMRSRIRNGRVPGVSNPAEAEDLVKRGSVTYRQARNIARFGNVDSLIYDLKTQSVVASGVFTVSFLVGYAQARRSGMSNVEAIRAALYSSIQSGASSVIAGVVGAQLLRTSAAGIGAANVRIGVRAVADTNVGRAAVHRIAAGSLHKGVYGAAAVNHVSKLLRTNVITGAATAAVTCAPDFYRAAFDGSISWKQFMKNAAVNTAGVGGGLVGWMGGAAAGAAVGSVLPGPGTAIGGVVGGIVGGLAGGIGAHKISKGVADAVVDDDSKALISAIDAEVTVLASEYMLTENEVERFAKRIGKIIDQKWLRRMYKQSRDSDPRRFVRRELEGEFKKIARVRPIIPAPSMDDFERGVQDVVGELGEYENDEDTSQVLALIKEAQRQRDCFKTMAESARAEYDNFKERVAQECADIKKHARENLLLKLISVADDFSRAVNYRQSEDAIDGQSWFEGVQNIHRDLETLLRNEGLSRIEVAIGEPFDVHLHDAKLVQETIEVDDGAVLKVLRDGYRLHDRVFRPSEVVVARAPEI